MSPRFSLRAALLLLLLVAPAAGAAPVVTQDTQVPILAHYDEAARELGLPEWGQTLGDREAVHVIVRLNLREVQVGISVPASVPPAQAGAWFRELSDALGWTDVALSSARRPDGTFLTARLEKATRPSGLGQQQFRLDVPRLRAELARLTPLPLRLAVRTRAQELRAAPSPAVQGTRQRSHYAFYADPGPAARPLALTYGMGRRWQAAMVCAWLAWALFPTLVFYAVRELQLRDPDRTPKERWETYRRWTKPVWFATTAGMLITPWFLSLEGMAYLLSPLGSMVGSMIWPAFAWISIWVVMPQSLFGYSLAREVSERQRKQTFAELLRKQLLFFVLINALIPLLFLIPTAVHALPWGKSTDPMPLWGKAALGLLFLSLPALGLGLWISSERRWRLRAKGLPSGEREASPELLSRVRDLTARLATPVTRVLIVPKGDLERQRGAVIHGEVATIYEGLAGKLGHDQLAGLITAERLGAPQGWKSKLPGAVGMTLVCLGFGGLAWMVLSGSSNSFTPSGPQLLLAFVSFPLSSVPLFIDQRLRRQRQDHADLVVADALGDSSLFLNALKTVELLRMETSNLDPELVPVPPLLTERRRRLERKLGLE
jgi:hypothetical protein